MRKRLKVGRSNEGGKFIRHGAQVFVREMNLKI